MLTINERLKDKNELYRRMMNEEITGLRVASPGIIQSFNDDAQTVTVQIAIREKININGNITWEEIPELLDVPLIVLGGGGYSVTFPFAQGDECLVVFGDNCMDAWWQSGGIQNQADKRRHDLSDGYAIVGLRSQPRVLSGYSTNTMQLRNDAGTAYFEIAGSAINIHGSSVTINGNTTIDGKNFLGHTHGGVMPGGSNTSGVS
ncbi:MAG: putative bacteriophage protein [Pelosinus sp.]|jgi:hypothetical protein|nr:putative bacteriophage protein [Pelosinus sp.]